MSSGLVHQEAVREDVSQASPSSWCHQKPSVSLGLETPPSDGCLTFLGLLPVFQSPSLCLCPPLFLEDVSHWIDGRRNPGPRDPELITSAKTCFPKKVVLSFLVDRSLGGALLGP